MLVDLMQKSFGVKDVDQYVRVQYAHSDIPKEDFRRYHFLMTNFKNRIDIQASLLTSDVRAANSIYPTTLSEYDQRREYQNKALVDCELIIKEMQRVVDIFNVDINIYKRVTESLYKEKDLIKKWRQHDNRLKTRL